MPLRDVQGGPAPEKQERRFPKVRANLAPWLVLAVGLGASFLFAKQISDAALEREEARFATAVEEARATLASDAEQYAVLVVGAAGLYSVSDDIARAHFEDFINRMQFPEHFPAASGIGYAAPGPDSPGEGGGEPNRAPVRVEYFVRHDGESHDIAGLDLSEDPALTDAMNRARDTSKVVLTDRLSRALPGVEPADSARFAIVAPVYRGTDVPVTEQARQESLRGYVFAPLQIQNLVEHALARQRAAGLRVDVYGAATADPARRLHTTRDEPLEELSGPLVRAELAPIVDRTWLFVYSAAPNFVRTQPESLASSVIMVGVGISVLLFVLLHRDGQLRRRSELVHSDLLSRERAARTEAQGAVDLLKLAEDAAQAGVWEIDVITHTATWSDSLYRLFGVNPEGFQPTLESWILCIHPEDRGKVRDAVQAAIENHGGINVEYRAPHPEFGNRWLLQAGRTFGITEIGRPLRMAGIVLDITARKEWEEHQKLLLAELNHRVKNTLAIVQSIASQTMKHSESTDSFREAFEGRLRALAKAHGLITQSHWKLIDLRSLVQLALAPYSNERGDNIVIDGPPVSLRTAAALALSMILHELGTNAAKYGALSVPGGCTEVRWKLLENGGARSVYLTWRETGGPPVQPSGRRGFGSKLIERSVEYDLGGRALLDFRGDGLWCEVVFPLDMVSAAEAAFERVAG